MPVFHLTAQIIGRGTGRSAVAAAYRAGARLAEAGTGIVYDYTRKAGVIHSAVLLPAGAPDRFSDRAQLWNEVEAFEKRKDAQLAREIELALPRELSDADNIALARGYVQEQLVARGMIAGLNLHKPVGKDGEPHPHAHVMLTMRAVGEAGFGPKQRAWNSTELLHDWREALAVRTNQALAERGHAVRVDHRSHQERGIALEPQSKIGAPGRSDGMRGRAARRTAEHRALAGRNGERLAAEPSIALELLTEHSATFTRRELARLVATHSDGAEQFARPMARVLGHAAEAGAKVVLVGDPEQLQSIQAGGWFRDLLARHRSATLAEVRRQRDGWQREATIELATGRTEAALVRYEAAGMIRAAATQEQACEALIAAWALDRRAVSGRSRIILAATRQDVGMLNAMARERLQREGLLAGEEMVATARGARAFAAGDRVLFLRNERSMAVRNGTLGSLERVDGQQLTVRLDGPGERRVSFHARDWDQLAPGYATTIHKAQGTTVDTSYLLLSGQMDRHGSYVALSRHRHGTAAFHAGDQFAGLGELARRDGSKATALPPETQPAADRATTRQRFAGLRAALGRVRAMARSAGKREASPERRSASVAGGQGRGELLLIEPVQLSGRAGGGQEHVPQPVLERHAIGGEAQGLQLGL